MLNQLVAITLIIMSVCITADLFIKKDQSLNKTVRNFETNTKKLHKAEQ